MSYPNGPSGPPGGYGPPQQPGGSVFGQPPAAPNPFARMGVPALLTLAVLVLGLVQYFCSFGGGFGFEVELLLAGGLLAGLSLFPPAPNTLPFAAVLSLVGGLGMLDQVINLSNGGVSTGAILVLVIGLVEAAAAVLALLLEYNVVKLAPRQATPHSVPTYPAAGGYPPAGGQHQPPSQSQQNTTFMTPQSTQWMQHPGQLGQQQGND